MEANMMSPADMAALMGNNDKDCCGGSWWLIILFLFFMNGGWGNGWNRNGQNAYTQEQAMSDTNFNNLDRRVQSIADRQYQQANNMTKGLADGFYSTLNAINGVQSKIAECCCNNQLAVSQLSAQTDKQTAAIMQAIHADGQQTRALIQTNEIQALRDKIGALEADNRMAGVVRYPMAYAYSAGPSPFCGCNCGMNNV